MGILPLHAEIGGEGWWQPTSTLGRPADPPTCSPSSLKPARVWPTTRNRPWASTGACKWRAT